MSILTHSLRHAALAATTAGACSLSLLAIAQAGTAGNPPAVHKRHLQREPYFGYLTGVAAAWVSGQCDQPGQSHPPLHLSDAPSGAPYYYEGWPYYRSGWWRPGWTFSDKMTDGDGSPTSSKPR